MDEGFVTVMVCCSLSIGVVQAVVGSPSIALAARTSGVPMIDAVATAVAPVAPVTFCSTSSAAMPDMRASPVRVNVRSDGSVKVRERDNSGSLRFGSIWLARCRVKMTSRG